MMASVTGHVMNLANSVIGVSLLAMPFCFKQCGITLAIVMLILSSMISRLACHFLVKSSTMCRRRNFEFLALYTFGPSGKLLVELGVIGFMMGTCVAFFVVMGDLGPAIVSKIFNLSNNSTLRTSVLTGLGLLVVLPLGLLRNVDSLAAISTVTIAYYFLFILKIFIESSTQLVTGDWWSHVKFWQPEGILQCIPIFAMALSCQTQLFEIYNSLPSPSIEKMSSVVRSALNLCTLLYASVGLLGYIAYCKENLSGNIMMSFTPSLSSEMFKLGFVMSIAVSFPLVIFPCRASLFSLMFRRVPIHHELSQAGSHIPDSRYKCLTVAIVSVALVTGLLIPSIELVLGFVGSTIGVAICVIFPSLSFLSLHNKSTNERLMAKVTLMFGLLIMVMGTFGNLLAAVEHKPVHFPAHKLEDSKSAQQIKVPPKVESSTEMAKKYKSDNNNYVYKKGVALVKPFPPERSVEQEAAGVGKPRVKVAEDVRKEPPVPIAPAPGAVEEQRRKADAAEVEKGGGRGGGEGGKEAVSEGRKGSGGAQQSERINKDAIEKEEREIMEVEKQKKAEEEEKQEEFLKKLKQHQDEQKKLLREQERILKEMRSRESGKRPKESARNAGVLPKEVKRIKPEEFKANINKIQTVIESLRETKSILEKDRNASESAGGADGRGGAVRNASSVPLPLAKLQSQSAGRGKAKGGVEREKRATEGGAGPEGECVDGGEKAEAKGGGVGGLLSRVKESEKTEGAAAGNGSSAVVIGKSEHLSLEGAGGKRAEIPPEGSQKLVPDLENQAFMPKKRDLKSVAATAN